MRHLQLSDHQNIGTKNGNIALDCSIRQTRHTNIFVISTVDFFFPLVPSPYVQGRIGAANVLSDLYATGVTQCDNVLLLVAACTKMTESERFICTKEMIRGFQYTCEKEANTTITGGQTVLNPWPIIGGIATSIVKGNEFIRTDQAQIGDVLILTKPLGTQIAVNVHQWKTESTADHNHNNTIHPLWKKCIEKNIFQKEDRDDAADEMMHQAIVYMVRLNKNAASLMIKYGATACTDVTGFGILGHCQNLLENQQNSHNNMQMMIHTLPCIKNTMQINDTIFNFQLRTGYSAETSGGLLICMSPTNAIEYCKELQQLSEQQETCWIIGNVVEYCCTTVSSSSSDSTTTTSKAMIHPDCQIIEV